MSNMNMNINKDKNFILEQLLRLDHDDLVFYFFNSDASTKPVRWLALKRELFDKTIFNTIPGKEYQSLRRTLLTTAVDSLTNNVLRSEITLDSINSNNLITINGYSLPINKQFYNFIRSNFYNMANQFGLRRLKMKNHQELTKQYIVQIPKMINIDVKPGVDGVGSGVDDDGVIDQMTSLSPYRGALLYHDMGTGKTYTGTHIGISFIKTYRFPRIKMLQRNQKDYDYRKDNAGKAVFMYYNRLDRTWRPSIYRYLQEFYDLDSYVEQFGEDLISMASDDEIPSTDRIIKHFISNHCLFIKADTSPLLVKTLELTPLRHNIVVIDEVHNVISYIKSSVYPDKPGSETKIGQAVYDWLMSSHDTKIIGLSGTPVINKPEELLLLANILTGYIDVDQQQTLFDMSPDKLSEIMFDGQGRLLNPTLMSRRLSGLVSRKIRETSDDYPTTFWTENQPWEEERRKLFDPQTEQIFRLSLGSVRQVNVPMSNHQFEMYVQARIPERKRRMGLTVSHGYCTFPLDRTTIYRIKSFDNSRIKTTDVKTMGAPLSPSPLQTPMGASLLKTTLINNLTELYQMESGFLREVSPQITKENELPETEIPNFVDWLINESRESTGDTEEIYELVTLALNEIETSQIIDEETGDFSDDMLMALEFYKSLKTQATPTKTTSTQSGGSCNRNHPKFLRHLQKLYRHKRDGLSFSQATEKLGIDNDTGLDFLQLESYVHWLLNILPKTDKVLARETYESIKNGDPVNPTDLDFYSPEVINSLKQFRQYLDKNYQTGGASDDDDASDASDVDDGESAASDAASDDESDASDAESESDDESASEDESDDESVNDSDGDGDDVKAKGKDVAPTIKDKKSDSDNLKSEIDAFYEVEDGGWPELDADALESFKDWLTLDFAQSDPKKYRNIKRLITEEGDFYHNDVIDVLNRYRDGLNEFDLPKTSSAVFEYNKNNVSYYSPKIARILETITDPDNRELHFIYSSKVIYGTFHVEGYLQSAGYMPYIFNTRSAGSSVETIEAEAKRELDWLESQVAPPNNRRFYIKFTDNNEAIVNGNTVKSAVEFDNNIMTDTITYIFNSERNKHGELIKVLVGSDKSREGLNLYHVRQVYIMEPWWNMVKPEQAMGRSIRYLSHYEKLANGQERGFPDAKDRYVKIDLLVGVMTEEQSVQLNRISEPSTDQRAFDKSRSKLETSFALEKVLNDVAIDCGMYNVSASVSGSAAASAASASTSVVPKTGCTHLFNVKETGLAYELDYTNDLNDEMFNEYRREVKINYTEIEYDGEKYLRPQNENIKIKYIEDGVEHEMVALLVLYRQLSDKIIIPARSYITASTTSGDQRYVKELLYPYFELV